MAHQWAPTIKEKGITRGPLAALFAALAQLRQNGHKLPAIWADYLVSVWGEAPSLYMLSGDGRWGEIGSDLLWGEGVWGAREIMCGRDHGFGRLLGETRIEEGLIRELALSSNLGRMFPHVRQLSYETPWRTALTARDEDHVGELLARACPALETLEWGAGDGEGVHVVDLDPFIRSCPGLSYAGCALPRLEDAPHIKRVSLRQAHLYNETERVERRLDRLGKLEYLAISHLREVDSKPARTALARLEHVNADLVMITSAIHDARRKPLEALEWARAAAKTCGARTVYVDGPPHTVANITRTFKGSGLLVRWMSPKSGKLREEQF